MQLVRIKDIAKEYGLSRSVFYRWHCYGKYPKLFAKIGGALFVDENELIRMARDSKER